MSFVRVLIGFTAGAAGCVCGALGDVFIRHAFMQVDPPAAPSFPKFQSWLALPLVWRKPIPAVEGRRVWLLWGAGMAFACIGNPVLVLLGLALAPATLIISLSAFSLAVSIAGATYFLGEELTVGGALGCSGISIGLLGMLMAFRGADNGVAVALAVSDSLTSPFGAIYAMLMISLLAGSVLLACSATASGAVAARIYATLGWRERFELIGKNSPPPLEDDKETLEAAQFHSLIGKTAAAVSAGIASGHAELAAKTFVGAFIEKFAESQAGGTGFWWSLWLTGITSKMLVIEIVLLVILVIDLVLLNLSLKKGEAIVIVPIRNATNIIVGSIGGVAILQEIPAAPGLLAISLGVLLASALLVATSQRPSF